MRVLITSLLALIGCTSGASGVRATVDGAGAPTGLAFQLEADPSDGAPQVEQIALVGYRGRSNSGATHWVVVRRAEGPPLPLPFRVEYGEAPPGFVVARRARSLPLTPGPYEVRIRTSEGTAVTSFRIGRDGRVE